LDFEIADGENLRRRIGGTSAKNGANAGDQFARIERLWEIVVGAGFESGNAVGVISAGSEHDDGNLRMETNAAENFAAVENRPHDVEDDDLECLGERFADAGFAVMSGGDSKAIHFEELRERLAECGVIVNQQDRKRFGHGSRHQVH